MPIDPRIRKRRVEVRRIEGRRRLRLLITVLVALALTAGTWLALRSPLVDLDRVRVTGAARTDGAEILRAGGLEKGIALIDVDEGSAARGIEGLPWVADAVVRRDWPATVAVQVTERREVATAPAADGGWALMDGSGRVLEQVAEQPPGLVPLEGLAPAGAPGTELAEAGALLRVLALLSPQLVERLGALAAVEGGELQLKLTPRGTVRLGPADNLPAKVRAMESVLAQVDVERLEILDVRLPSSPVLTREPVRASVSTLSAG